jgi:hypothetical protein
VCDPKFTARVDRVEEAWPEPAIPAVHVEPAGEVNGRVAGLR